MGGRSSVSGLKVTVFGATGFVGRYLINKLGRIGSQVVVPYRGNEYDMMHLRPMGDLGQIIPMPFHLKDQDSIIRAVRHSDVVVNLIAQDRPTRNFSLQDVHVKGLQSIADACNQVGVGKFIHVSSAQAVNGALSNISCSRADGEALLGQNYPKSVIVRPSALFGYEDRFLHAIGTFSTFPLGFPVANHGRAKRSPLYIGDLAEGLTRLCLLDSALIEGQTFDLLGPHQYTLHDIIKIFCYLTVRPEKIVNLSPLLFWLYARLYPEWRRPLFTRDLIKMLQEDEIRLQGSKSWPDLGMNVLELKTLENHALPFVRCYRQLEDFVKALPRLLPPEPLASVPSEQPIRKLQ